MQSVIMLKEQFAVSRNVIAHANDSEAKVWAASTFAKRAKPSLNTKPENLKKASKWNQLILQPW